MDKDINELLIEIQESYGFDDRRVREKRIKYLNIKNE
jgi:hypothetical protein